MFLVSENNLKASQYRWGDSKALEAGGPPKSAQKLRWSLYLEFLLRGSESLGVPVRGFWSGLGQGQGTMAKKYPLFSKHVGVCGRGDFFFSFSQLVQENKGLEMTALRPNTVTDMFCLAHTGFSENSEPTLKNRVISHKYLHFGMS